MDGTSYGLRKGHIIPSRSSGEIGKWNIPVSRSESKAVQRPGKINSWGTPYRQNTNEPIAIIQAKLQNCRLFHHFISLPKVRGMKNEWTDLKTGVIAYAPKFNVVRREHWNLARQQWTHNLLPNVITLSGVWCNRFTCLDSLVKEPCEVIVWQSDENIMTGCVYATVEGNTL